MPHDTTGTHLPLVVSLSLDLSLLLESVDDISVSPSDLVRDTLEGAELASWLETENTESGGNDHLLDLVLGGGDTLVEVKTEEGSGTTGGLVRDLLWRMRKMNRNKVEERKEARSAQSHV
jgi:hypothetical protein